MTTHEPKYFNPFTDYGFKELFGKEYSKDILIDFLNELYSDLPNMRKIVDIRYADKEMSRKTEDGRTVIYDIHCQTDNGHYLIVEMQVNSQLHFLNRAIYYLCRSISEQGEIGDDWKYDFKPVYGIFFANFKMTGLEAKVKIHSEICDIEEVKPISDKICLSFIQLPYFTKRLEECISGFDQWIYVLKHLSTMNTMPFTAEKEIFKKVANISDLHRLSPNERQEYDAALKRYRDYNTTYLGAIESGRVEGIAEGRAQGIAEGRAEGRAQGITEGEAKSRLEIARKMLAQGFSIEQIQSLTNLSESEIDELK